MKWWPSWRKTAPCNEQRWIVLDVESSGLDAKHDRLLAIAALAVGFGHGGPQICLGDSFEVLLQQEVSEVDKANILLHGIGVGAQREGITPRDGLAAFEQWIGSSPLIAFHAAFDQAMIQGALQRVLGHTLPNPWVDLAQVAEAVQPEAQARSLDEWLALFNIECAVRHQAAADTLATAELFLRLWPMIAPHGGHIEFQAVQRLASNRRWLRGG